KRDALYDGITVRQEVEAGARVAGRQAAGVEAGDTRVARAAGGADRVAEVRLPRSGRGEVERAPDARLAQKVVATDALDVRQARNESLLRRLAQSRIDGRAPRLVGRVAARVVGIAAD